MERFFKHPRIIAAAILVITVFFALRIPSVQLDNNNLRFVPEDDEARKVSAYIDDTFGSSLFILVGLERKYGTIFDAEFLNQVRRYVERIEEIEVIGTINSLVNSDYIYGTGDAVVVEKLVGEDFTGTPEEVAVLKERLLSWDMYRRSLISDDFTATQILVPLEISTENAGDPEVVDSFIQIRNIAWEMFEGYADVYVTGLPVISATINEAVRADLLLLVPLVIVVILLVLFFSFRRLAAVILPLLTVLIAVIWSIGAMPLFGVKLSVVSTVLPVILTAVGSAYGIHVITHYLGDRLQKEGLSAEEHRELIFSLLRRIGKAVFLAAITTFAGFASFCFTSVLPIREFGFFSSFGVIVSFVMAVTLIPSLLLIRGPLKIRNSARKTGGDEKPEEETPAGTDPLSAVIADTFVTITRKRRFIIFSAALVLLVSVYGISKVVIDNIFVEYFKPSTDIYRSDRFIRDKFGGSKVVSVVLEAENSETLLHPDNLNAMDKLGDFLEKRVGETGKTIGFTDLIKRINQAFNANAEPGGLGEQGSDPFPDGEFSFEDYDDDFSGDFSGGEWPEEEAPGKTYTVEELFALLDRAARSGSARSVSGEELIWELQKLINYGGASYYEIPSVPERYGLREPEELRQLISGYLMLLSGNTGFYANDPLEPTAIKTTVQLKTVGEEDTGRAVRAIRDYIKDNFPPNLKVTVGGSALVESSLNRLVVQSQLSSVLISLLLVFLIIALSNRSIIAGCIGIAPLSISILINFAVMGFLGIKLNIGTSMVASVSVGIGIDYTIHYMETFKREYRASGGQGDFLRRTFATSGKAILINAVSVGAGFAVLLLSQFIMLEDLGLLIALTMGTSALVSLTVIPVLLMSFNPQFIRKE
jgi:predicted RND superfamily exporter protein